jgi:phospholipid transport system substrate-binding protein
MKKILTMMLVALAALCVAPVASAGDATEYVRTHQTKLFEVVAKKKSQARQDELRTMFDALLAYDIFAKRSLGKEWKNLSDSERQRFTDLLTQLIRNNYRRNLENMLDFNIEYVGEEQLKNKAGDPIDEWLVKSVATHKTNAREPQIEINFLVGKKKDGSFWVFDIAPEGASMTKTYRSQFLRIIQKDGVEKLFETMQKKLDEDAKLAQNP